MPPVIVTASDCILECFIKIHLFCIKVCALVPLVEQQEGCLACKNPIQILNGAIG